MNTPEEIVDRYTYARLAGDSATMAAIIRSATEHDKANPGRAPLMPLITDAAFRYPAPASDA